MKILIVSHIPTHPTNAGNRSCMMSYAELLVRMGHQVELLYLHMPWTTAGDSLEPMRAWWGNGYHQFTQSDIDRLVQLVHHKVCFRAFKRYSLDAHLPFGAASHLAKLVAAQGYQAVIVNYWAYSGLFVGLPQGVKRVLFTHDNFGDRFQTTGGGWLSTDKVTEGRAFDRSQVVLAIQEEEAVQFRKHTSSDVMVSYSPFEAVSLPVSGTRNILYLASGNPNNVEGLRRFVSEVLPLLLARDASIRLLVGGRVCQMVPELAGEPGLVLQGEVVALADFYAQGDVVVNPVFTGSGLKIKTFEAMAFGRMMVCDPHSLEGIYRPDLAPVRACASPMEYAKVIMELLSDPEGLRQGCLASLEYIRQLNLEVERVFAQAIQLDLSPRVGQ